MLNFGDITLDFSHQPKEVEQHTYHLGNDYFEQLKDEEILGGEVDLVITVEPVTGSVIEIDSEPDYELTFEYTGQLSIRCDRCLAPMSYEIDFEDYVSVKLGDALDDQDDSLITLDAQEPVYDFGQIAYELLALELPYVHSHEDLSDCDPKMLAHLITEFTPESLMSEEYKTTLKQKIEEINNKK